MTPTAAAAIQPDPEPKPVAWRWPDPRHRGWWYYGQDIGAADAEPLYATPSSASMVSVEEAGWQPIETAPADEELILGWFNTEFMGGRWSCVVDFAHNTRGGWWHGQATHLMPLPEPPALRALAGEGGR